MPDDNPCTSALTVSAAAESDIPLLSGLLRASVEGSCRHDYTPAQIAAWTGRCTGERWRELLRSDLRFLVARSADGTPMGFASVRADGFLHSMFVVPVFQRAGVATRLLREAERLASAAGAVEMESEVSLTARPFFEHSGFTVIRRQQVPVGSERLTNFVMRKKL